MTLEMPSETDIYNDLEQTQSNLTTQLLATAPTSFRYILNKAWAHVLKEVYDTLEAIENNSSILTAEGTYLDALVSDRLIGGRRLGEYSTGIITFIKSRAAESDITIPAGTQVIGMAGDGTSLIFKTTAEGTLTVGNREVAVAGVCETRGTIGNVATQFISSMYSYVAGIDVATNYLQFTGGTDSETDDELRQRYIDAIWINGRASRLLIERHLSDVEGVTEVKANNKFAGDMEIIVDIADGTLENNDDINDAIEDNIACGTVARGCLAATLQPDSFSLADCAGGYIWLRPKGYVTTNETATINYLNQSLLQRTATCTIPAGTVRGDAVIATLEDEDDRAISIYGGSRNGYNEYDILIGMGTYPYLYNVPELVSVSTQITLELTEAPETNLSDNIETSLTEFIAQLKIGEYLDWSDAFNFITHEFEGRGEEGEFLTGRQFIGIDRVNVLRIIGKGQTINGTGEYILIEDDERIEPGAINITVV